MPEGDLGSLRYPQWSLQSLYCDHLANTASVIVNFGGRAPTRILPASGGLGAKVFKLYDDEEDSSGGDMQADMSPDICLDRRLPQVYGMQNIDHQPLLSVDKRKDK